MIKFLQCILIVVKMTKFNAELQIGIFNRLQQCEIGTCPSGLSPPIRERCRRSRHAFTGTRGRHQQLPED